uniref:Solute carrier family 35 member F5 n=1 Tax=Trichuris muris TaxID=70415 RepID=A0A5S6Q8A9_TRIMR
MEAADKRRFVLGCLALLLVNVLWVVSAESSRFIFRQAKFERPFFVTYVKACLFSIYLVNFYCTPRWRRLCPDRLSGLEQQYGDHPPENQHSTPTLSEPLFERVNFSDEETDDHLEAKDVQPSDDLFTGNSPKKVSFNEMHEVRILPANEATEAHLARLPYAVWVRVAHKYGMSDGFHVKQTYRLALMFFPLWFTANLSYSEALDLTESSIVNILSSTSSLFTLLLSSLIPSSTRAEKFNFSKLFSVALTIVGVYIVSSVDQTSFEVKSPFGIVWSLVGSFGYAVYAVMLRYKVDPGDRLEMPMFFGFVGLNCMIFLWPFLFLLNLVGLESLYPLPDSTQWLYILLNGLLGTVIAEYLWLRACFLTSTFLATLSLSLIIPMTLITDRLLWKTSFPVPLYLGTLPMLLSFFGATVLSVCESWDPILSGVTWTVGQVQRLCCYRRKAPINRTDLDIEQSISLITDPSSP